MLVGYDITGEIYRNARTVVYRATRLCDRLPVVIKTLCDEYPSLRSIARVRHEYSILSELDAPGIIRAHEIIAYDKSIAIVEEHFPGAHLHRYIQEKQPDLGTMLRIAVAIAGAIAAYHERGVIHRDLSPLNILVNDEAEIRIIDFDIASRLQRENQGLCSPASLEGTLAYMAPEQTGRMSHDVDLRADLYAFGVILYEALVGRHPFPITDPMELLHCHIAKEPEPPHVANPAVPPGLSALVTKLMAKTVEERYQSAYGVKADLEECQRRWTETGSIEPFPLGRQDDAGKLCLPQKLYGRSEDIAILLDAFDRVCAGSSELMLIAGYSGIGKSALAYEVHKPMVERRGTFTSGKFDQLSRGVPYSAIIEAFGGLARQILGEDAAGLERWRRRILGAVGNNGRVITEFFPAFELILGEQPPIPELDSADAQRRFAYVFTHFIRALAAPDRPLVIFLDDLQWADAGSLKLIQAMMVDSGAVGLLIIGAYRDNEVDETHPFSRTRDEIASRGSRVSTTKIGPLLEEDVSALLCDTLATTPERVAPLCELVFRKTRGNPFFLTQFLRTLHKEGQLRFDRETRRWVWDIDKIDAMGLSDNVIDLMSRKLSDLPEETLRLMKMASVIGNKFDLDVLAAIDGEAPLEATARALWPALAEGLLLASSQEYRFCQAAEQEDRRRISQDGAAPFDLSASYRFLHDRVQQAAYHLTEEALRSEVHLKFGRELRSTVDESEARLLDVTNHLNLAVSLIEDLDERLDLARLNVRAAERSRLSGAHEAALRHATAGERLLPEDRWETQYDLALAVMRELIEAEYVAGNYSRAEALYESTLAKLATVFERAELMELMMRSHTGKPDLDACIDTGLRIFDMVGMPFLPEGYALEVPPIEELAKLPEMTDPRRLLVLKVLSAMMSPVFVARSSLLPSIFLTFPYHCFEGGNSPLAALAYAVYGMYLTGANVDLRLGYAFGDFGMDLLRKYDRRTEIAKVHNIFYSHVNPWGGDARRAIKGLKEGVEAGMETGDIEWACYCANNFCMYSFMCGEHIADMIEQQQIYINLIRKSDMDTSLHMAWVWMQMAKGFAGKTRGPQSLSDEGYDEDELLPVLVERKNFTAVYGLALGKLMMSYHARAFRDALSFADKAVEHSGASFGFMNLAFLNCFCSLTYLACAQLAETPGERDSLAERARKNQETMRQWVDHAAINYEHMHALVEAELAWVEGDHERAETSYDRAIEAAKRSKYLHFEALANERAGELYLARGRERIAMMYLREAHYLYQRWGMELKVRDLQGRYPSLRLTSARKREGAGELSTLKTSSTKVTTTDLGTFNFDIAALSKASQTIAAEIEHNKLHRTLMQVVLENAGAQRGALLLQRGGELFVVAEGGDEGGQIRASRMPLSEWQGGARSVISYVFRAQEAVISGDASRDKRYMRDPYLQGHEVRSLLCMPIRRNADVVGALYLENNLAHDAFTDDRIVVLSALAGQAAISLENAELYGDLNTALLAAKESERLKSEFLAATSHELRTPLNAIINVPMAVLDSMQEEKDLFCPHCGDRFAPDEDADEGKGPLSCPSCERGELERGSHWASTYTPGDLIPMMQSIVSSGKQLLGVVNNVLEIGRLESGRERSNFTRLSLASVIESSRGTLEALARPKDIRLRVEMPDPSLEVEVDQVQIRQVLINLVDNAIKFSQSGESVEIGHAVDGAYVEIVVRDHGIGIPEESHALIFESFRQLHAGDTRAYGGVGLGLSIAKQLVERHHGAITLESKVGEGTTFRVRLPLCGPLGDGEHSRKDESGCAS